MESEQLTFWEHLDVLRGCLIRIFAAIIVGGVAAFFFKDTLFSLVLAPSRSDFFMYQLLGAEPFQIHLINTDLTEQMMIHLKMAASAGVLLASPYIIYSLFSFVTPALRADEYRYSVRFTFAAYLMFMLGIVVNYLLIFPLTVRFLATYQVSTDIDNMLTISSYINTLLMMSFLFGIVFEIPALSWLLAKFGILRAAWMRQYRRHAIVAILILSAVITPTSDLFTLTIVSLPIWLLYELSIFLVKRVNRTN